MKLCACLVFLYAAGLWGQVNVLTANYGNNRTNANAAETALTVANVNSSHFGRLFALPVDGDVYAQPLYVSQLTVSGQGTHNVVFVETMHNTVFAFDADAYQGQPLWTANLGAPVPNAVYNFQDIQPEVGILGTPVIDLASKTMYVVSDNYDGTVCSYQLHALNITTGAEQPGSPITIAGAVAGTSPDSNSGILTFNAQQHLQRPGLLLSNGMVYIAFGSHADIPPYHGWIFAYNEANISQAPLIFCTSPNGSEGAIWQSGRGLAADAQGNIYVSTGNGDFDGLTSFGESFLKLTPTLVLADWFTPDSWLNWNEHDYDLGSSGIALIPGTTLMLGGGKSGAAFVTQTGNLGHTEAGNGQVTQQFAPAYFGMFNMAVWNSPTGPILYAQNLSNAAAGYRFTNGQFETNASLVSGEQTGSNYEGIAVSSNGIREGTGIVWATTAPMDGPNQPGVLVALNALDPSTTLWSSSLDSTDNLGYFAKFVTPTVANGKVYVPSFSHAVLVYGLKQSAADTPEITAITNAASYATGSVSPGELVVLYGVALGTLDLEAQEVTDGFFGDMDDDTSVTFGGLPAPVIYSSATAVCVIVPFGISGSSVPVQATYQGRQSATFLSNVTAAVPGLFSIDASGSGQGAFLNQDMSVNSAANPAARGQVLVLYATGLGTLSPLPPDGAITAGTPPLLQNPVSVTIGGVTAQVQYAGAAPGAVAGVMQINASIPGTITPGNNVPVVVQVAGAGSQTTVTAAIE